MNLELFSTEEQEQFGAQLAACCGQRAIVIYLQGDLGTGKTTLVRGFLRGYHYQGTVKSPTYTLMEPYILDGWTCYHYDLYRLASPDELDYLMVRDLLDGQAALLIEWPERGEGALPTADLWIKLAHLGEGRQLVLTAHSPTGEAVLTRLSQPQ